MSARSSRNYRTLVALGGEYDETRVEADVWTVNPSDEEEPLPDPEDIPAPIAEVHRAAGDIADVTYAGAAGRGYVRVSTGESVSQQAFAGAARSAGGERTGAGTFGEGAKPAVRGPSLSEVRARADEVRAVIRSELPDELIGELNLTVVREEDREEVPDPVTAGIDEVVRVRDKGRWYRYRVERGSLVRDDGARGP